MKKFNMFQQAVAVWCAAFLALAPLAAFHALAPSAGAATIESLPDNPSFNWKIKLTYADFATAASATASNVTFQIFPGGTGTLPSGFTVMDAAYVLVTPFDAAGTLTTGITVGDDLDADRLIINKEVAVDSTEVLYFTTANATDTIPFSYLGATNYISITATNGGGILVDGFTAGEIHVFLKTINLQKLTAD